MPEAVPGLSDPRWFTDIVRLGRAKAPWLDIVRFVIGIVTPLAVGLAFTAWAGEPRGLSAGVFAMIGALMATLAPQNGHTVEKLMRTAAGLVLGGAGLAVGQFAAGGGWQPVVVVAALAAVAGLLSSVSANVSFATLDFLVCIALGSGISSSLPRAESVGLFLAGGAWATLLTLVAAVLDPIDPDRAVVADVLGATGQLLAASGSGENPDVRRRVTGALDVAYNQVAISRSHTPGRSRRLRHLAGVLNAAGPLVEGTVALYYSGHAASPADIEAVAAMGDAVLHGRPLGGQAPPPPGDDEPAPARRVRDGDREVWETLQGDPSPPVHGSASPPVHSGRDWPSRASDLASETVRSPNSQQFAIRLALCMGIGEVVRQYLPYQRPYWVLLTVALVLKPDFGSTFVRGAQRLAGTVVGVLVGAALLVLVPHDGWLLIPLAIAVGAMPWTQAANYGLYVVTLTPVVVILLDFRASGGSTVVTARLADTLVGCGIVLVFGYLLWPNAWRSSLGASLQRTVQALDTYVAAAFTAPLNERRQVRRAMFEVITQLQTELQRQLSQPPPMNTRAAVWWPVIVQVDRAADAVVEADVAIDAGAAPPEPRQVTALRRVIGQLMGGGSCDAVPRELTTGVLAPIAQEVVTACRLLSEGPRVGVSSAQ